MSIMERWGQMTTLERAITWSGTDAELDLYVITASLPVAEPSFAFASETPHRVTTFLLEDEFGALGGLFLTEYGIYFDDIPHDLSAYLRSCLDVVGSGGARTAWFGFAAGFRFDRLLDQADVTEIYGILDSKGEISLALTDDDRDDPAWADRLARIHRQIDQRPPVRAKVVAFTSPKIGPEKYHPINPKKVSKVVRMVVEGVDGSGQESLDVTVCTPSALFRHKRTAPLIGRHLLIVERWDWPQIRDFLTNAVEAEVAPSWEGLRDRIGRIGKWEYEDFTPYMPDERPT